MSSALEMHDAADDVVVSSVPRWIALGLAVLHHGLSNLAEKSIPSRAETVLDTAHKFEEWLLEEDR